MTCPTNEVLQPHSSLPSSNQVSTKCYVIGISGGSGSGKTSVAERILSRLDVPWVAILSMDSFYKPLTPEETTLAYENNLNLDHPSALDYDLLFESLYNLKSGHAIKVPVYNFGTHAREEQTTRIANVNVIFFEGIYALYDQKWRDLIDLKIFVDTDADIRLARRIRRDMAERGRTLQGILTQYSRFVKPAFDEHVLPTKKYADVIIPRGLENLVAIDLITKHIQHQLNEIKRGAYHELLPTMYT